jgi:hypothetical protein
LEQRLFDEAQQALSVELLVAKHTLAQCTRHGHDEAHVLVDR